MCPTIQQMREISMAAGYAEGYAEGFAKGYAQGRMKAYAETVEDGMVDVHFAASKLGMTTEEFLQKTGITIPKS